MWFDVGKGAGRKRTGVRAERLADIIKLPHPYYARHTPARVVVMPGASPYAWRSNHIQLYEHILYHLTLRPV